MTLGQRCDPPQGLGWFLEEKSSLESLQRGCLLAGQKKTPRKSEIHVYVTRMAGVIQLLDHHMLTFDVVLYVN